jgi:hypothetical protein
MRYLLDTDHISFLPSFSNSFSGCIFSHRLIHDTRPQWEPPATEMWPMSITITGVVKNGVVVPMASLPEGAQVEIRLSESPIERVPVPVGRLTPAELRRMPREQRQVILAAAAEMAEQDYRSDKELTGFEAFSEEERNDDESDSR